MMKVRTLVSLSAVGICAFGAGLLVSPTIAEEPPDPAAMEAAWNDYMTPGPEHAHMAEHLVGQWEVSSKWWMAPTRHPRRTRWSRPSVRHGWPLHHRAHER
jgi:hypothetical protein